MHRLGFDVAGSGKLSEQMQCLPLIVGAENENAVASPHGPILALDPDAGFGRRLSEGVRAGR